MSGGARILLNGVLQPPETARLGIDDLGFLVGDGVFETLRVYDGAPFLLDEHLTRLVASLRLVQIDIPYSCDQLRDQVGELLESAGATPGDRRLRITVSRGPGSPLSGTRPATPTVLLTVNAYEPPAAVLYDRGAEVEISQHARMPHPLHGVKAISRQANLWLRREASAESTFEVLQCNDAGRLAEGSFTNVFVVDSRGVLRTPRPEEGCLDGITRRAVLALALRSGLQLREGEVERGDLDGAREMFLTGSLVEIVPVRSVDGRRAGAACPGAVTRALRSAYGDLVRARLALRSS